MKSIYFSKEMIITICTNYHNTKSWNRPYTVYFFFKLKLLGNFACIYRANNESFYNLKDTIHNSQSHWLKAFDPMLLYQTKFLFQLPGSREKDCMQILTKLCRSTPNCYNWQSCFQYHIPNSKLVCLEA